MVKEVGWESRDRFQQRGAWIMKSEDTTQKRRVPGTRNNKY